MYLPPGVQTDQLGRLALTLLPGLYPADPLSGEEVALVLHLVPPGRTPLCLLAGRAAPGSLQARRRRAGCDSSDLTVQHVLTVITEVCITEAGVDRA